MSKRNKMTVSSWWGQLALLTLLLGFTGLGLLAVSIYHQQPPVPARVASRDGRTLFTSDDIMAGQHLFQRRGLMQFGSLYGHGAYLGPDFTAQYLHRASLAMLAFHGEGDAPSPAARARVEAELKQNLYDPATGVLTFTDAQEHAWRELTGFYRDWFSGAPTPTHELKRPPILEAGEVQSLTSFFAWAAWTCTATRPGANYSYTNNWPPESLAGNGPTAQAFLWSVLSLISLLAGIGLVLFLFGRFNLLGWHRADEDDAQPLAFRPPEEVRLTPSQRAIPWYFLVVAGLFLAQGLLGGVNAHYHAEPAGFYGFDLAGLLPYNLSRMWHLQLSLFFVSASFLAIGIFVTPMIAGREPKHQSKLALLLFAALVVVVVGSLAGEAASLKGYFSGDGPWFWVGAQGWEFLDLGRLWQVLLAGGMLLWVFIVFRGLRPKLATEHPGNMPFLFLYSALSIPAFYAVGMVFGRSDNFAIVDFWRFWVVHLWVEDFLELFTTIMVAYLFVLLGVVHKTTATRIIYLDVILYSVGGVIGTMHHLYFSGTPVIHMAMGAFFSAMEVIPLVLLTVEAWRFMRLGGQATGGAAAVTGTGGPRDFPHKWAVMFLIAVGFWNFLGAGVFGFLINLPIVSYWEIGTQFTANHAHGAMMGVYGMLAMGFFMFVARYFVPPDRNCERAMKISFWSLNIGLFYMLFVNLGPIGTLQLFDAFEHGYWHARDISFFLSPKVRFLEWLRLPGDALFIVGGIGPVVYLAVRMFAGRNRPQPIAAGETTETFTEAAG